MASVYGIAKEALRKVKNAIAYIQKNEGSGYVFYGERDDLPNRIIEDINNSGTATLALSRLKQFIVADGFIDEATGKTRANKNQTWNDLLREGIGENESKLQAFALRLYFTVEGKIASTKIVPIPWIRRDGDYFKVNRLMGEIGKLESQTEILREFDPDLTPEKRRNLIKDEVKKYGKQMGELFYCFIPKLGRNYDFYSVPDYYSGIEDIQSDGKISELELTNIAQGWRAQVVISTGVIDNLTEDENGKTEKDYFDEELSEFSGENAARILHLQGRTPEEMPKVTVLDNKEIVDMTEKSTIRLFEKVCRLIGVPPVLCGLSQSGKLGDVQELKNTMELFYLTVRARQDFITSKLNVLKPLILNGENLNFEISRLNPFSLLPDSILSRLTDAELRELFEIPEVENDSIIQGEKNSNKTNEVLTNLTGRQMQGIQRIVRKFNKGDFSFEQAASMLKEGFGFDDQQVDIWLVTQEEEDADQ